MRDQPVEGIGGSRDDVWSVAGYERTDGDDLCELLHRRRDGADAVRVVQRRVDGEHGVRRRSNVCATRLRSEV